MQSYEGALILISHDRHLLRTTVDDFYLVYQHQVQPFKGDLDDYYQWLQTKGLTKEINQVSTANIYREKKSLQNRLKKIEQSVDQLHQRLSELETTLADLSLYEEGQQQRVQKLLGQQSTLQKELLLTEEEWLEVVSALETM